MPTEYPTFQVTILSSGQSQPLPVGTRREAIQQARQIATTQQSEVLLGLPSGYSQTEELIRPAAPLKRNATLQASQTKHLPVIKTNSPV